MPKIAIVGPGAVGSVLAALLHRTGRHEIVLCARRPVRELVVETVDGKVQFAPTVFTDPAKAAPVDWVFATTKAYDTPGASAWLPGLCAGAVPVAVIQNGVEHRARFAGQLPPDRILPVMIDCPAERTPEIVTQRAPVRILVADVPLGRGFVELFAGVPGSIGTTPDFVTAIWRKLCLNAAGVVSALTLQSNGVFRQSEGAEIAREIVRECVTVGRAEGAKLGDDAIEAVVADCRAAPPDGVNSLLADRKAGRPTEIDARNGVIVRLGRKHGISTPYNAMAVALFALLTAK